MDQVQDLIGRIRANPMDALAWERLAFLHLHNRQAQDLLKVLDWRHLTFGDGPSFCLAKLVLGAAGDPAPLEHLLAEIPPNSTHLVSVLYALGLVYGKARRLDECCGAVRRAALAYVRNASNVRFDTSSAHYLLGLANMVEPSGFTRPDAIAVPNMDLTLSDGFAASGPMVFACCDTAYFEAYGVRFLTSLRELGAEYPVVVGVINPNGDFPSIVASAREIYPNLALGALHGQSTAEFFSCARYLVAPTMLERFRQPLVCVDIDNIFPAEFMEIMVLAASVSVMVVSQPRWEPNVMYSAAILGMAPDDCGLEFARTMQRYLACKLAEDVPLWTIDQAAIHRAVSLAAVGCGSRILDLTDHFAGRIAMPWHFTADHLLEETDRMAMRSAQRFHFEMEPSGRPILTKSSQLKV